MPWYAACCCFQYICISICLLHFSCTFCWYFFWYISQIFLILFRYFLVILLIFLIFWIIEGANVREIDFLLFRQQKDHDEADKHVWCNDNDKLMKALGSTAMITCLLGRISSFYDLLDDRADKEDVLSFLSIKKGFW